MQPLLDSTRLESPALPRQLQIGRLLQVGQLLQAKVVAQPQPGLVRLQIANTELLARTQVTLEPGTRLELKVIKGHPLPELRVVREPTAREQQQQAVRTAIVRQRPPTEIRQTLGELRTEIQTPRQSGTEVQTPRQSGTEAPTPRQSEGVRQFTAILQDAGVRLNQLNPAQLQRAVKQSGIFHEARLASAMPPDPTDAKTRLLQLLTLLHNHNDVPANQKTQRPQPPGPDQAPRLREPGADTLLNRLVRLVEASVSRIQLQQAASLPVEEGARQAWQLDLPIHLPNETHEAMLRIERDAADKDSNDPATWAVNLAFQFDTIGTLQTRVALAGDRVSVTFWCERSDTQQTIEQRLPSLKEAFEAQGLEVVHLAGVRGEPAQPLISIPMPESLLDEHA